MIDHKLIEKVNKMADLLKEIKSNEGKFPNLVELGRVTLRKEMEELEKQLEELKEL